jgi:hypothetical protein
VLGSTSSSNSNSTSRSSSSSRRGLLLRSTLLPPLLLVGSDDATTIVNSILSGYGLPTLKLSKGFKPYDEFEDDYVFECEWAAVIAGICALAVSNRAVFLSLELASEPIKFSHLKAVSATIRGSTV